MKELLHKILFTGIGLAALTEEKAREMVDDLEKRGEVSREEGKKLAEDLIGKARAEADHLRDTVETEVNRLADKFMWVTRRDYDALKRRIEILEQRMGFAGSTTQPGENADN